MVRPTLIVGLGGTGVLICRLVEKYVSDLFNGYVPPFIRFLKLDTDAPEQLKADAVSGDGQANTSQSDFFNLFHHMDMGEVLRDLEDHPQLHPHLGWMEGFHLDTTSVDCGCQGITRLGRLVFVELRETVIHEAVASRFSDLRSSTQKLMEGEMAQFEVAPDGAPVVHIASSVCGGTGAGMLMDMAYNLRWWSRESFPRSAEIIAHLMLPEAFSVDPRLMPKLEAVAGATLEQIEFLSDSRREDMIVRYCDGERRFGHLTAPFNFLYLLNGQGDTGSGNRRHLVKMIARVIRSMAVEPAAQPVTSDANNKLNDVLGLLHPANGRRQCFGSYGFWFGTPGHQTADVEAWVHAALEAMGAGATRQSADYGKKVSARIAGHLDVSAKVKGVALPTGQFVYALSPRADTDADVERDVREQLAKHLAAKVFPVVEEGVKRILPAHHLNRDMLKSAEDMIEDAVFKATLTTRKPGRDTVNTGASKAKLPPLGLVGVCLGQWVEQLDRWIQAQRSAGVPDADAEAQALVDAAKGSLDLTAGLIALNPDEISQAVNDAIERHWPSLVEAFLRESRSALVHEVLKAFQVRKQALDMMVSLASEKAAGSAARVTTSARGNDEFFSTPLYASTDPTVNADSLAMLFRQNLIRPILQQVVLRRDGLASKDAEVEAVKDRLDGILADAQTKAAMQAFLTATENENSRRFHSPVPPGTSIPRHDYYRPVCDVLRLAAAKIDLSRSGVFEKGVLDVTVSQQVPNTCVPDLLAHKLGPNYREAYVNENYEKATKVWVQVLHLRYGFCLEAISTYKRYVDVTGDYLRDRGFNRYSDIWLDPRWYDAYRVALTRWDQAKGQRGGTVPVDRAASDAAARGIRQVREEAKKTLAGLSERIVESVGNPRWVLDAGGRLEKTRGEVEGILDSLSPPDAGVLGRARALCTASMLVLAKALAEMVSALPDAERAKMDEHLRWFRDEIGRIGGPAGPDDGEDDGANAPLT